MSDKQVTLAALKGLPEDVTFAEIREEIDLLAALHGARQTSAQGRVLTVEAAREELAIRTTIRRAERELDAGQGISHEEIQQRIAEWRSR